MRPRGEGGLWTFSRQRRTSATLSTLAECFYTLPAFARILFPRRNDLTKRWESQSGRIRIKPWRTWSDTLQGLGLRKSVGHLAFIADISHLTDYLWLAIDIEETGVTTMIGFDCYCRSTAQSENNRKWADLLDFFVDSGICTDHKRNALLGAADMPNREFDELAWPESLRRVSMILGPAGFNRMGLDIHHIKVIDRPGAPLEAKAYLCGVTDSTLPIPDTARAAWTTPLPRTTRSS